MNKSLLLLTVSLIFSSASLAAQEKSAQPLKKVEIRKDRVVAVVNGKEIKESDIDAVIDALPQEAQNLRNDEKFRKVVLENLIKEELLVQEAEREGLDKDPKVKEEIERARRQILVQALLQRHVKPKEVSVSEEEMKKFYEKNKKSFIDPSGKNLSYEKIKPFIKQTLEQQKQNEEIQKAVESYIDSLRKKAKIEMK